MKIKQWIKYFTVGEILLWVCSVMFITVSFLIFDREGWLTLAASLVGVTSLIFCAKGNPIGQALMIVFSTLYGIISFGCAYYGEMMTYLGMTLPMAIIALSSWLRHPYKGKKAEVEINRIGVKEVWLLCGLTAVVTLIFYFILGTLGTSNLFVSTFSVSTSFFAVYLCFRRTAYFPLAYALNDVVLIILWIMAAMEDASYLSVIVCFVAFLVNDLYSFLNWKRMERKQRKH